MRCLEQILDHLEQSQIVAQYARRTDICSVFDWYWCTNNNDQRLKLGNHYLTMYIWMLSYNNLFIFICQLIFILGSPYEPFKMDVPLEGLGNIRLETYPINLRIGIGIWSGLLSGILGIACFYVCCNCIIDSKYPNQYFVSGVWYYIGLLAFIGTLVVYFCNSVFDSIMVLNDWQPEIFCKQYYWSRSTHNFSLISNYYAVQSGFTDLYFVGFAEPFHSKFYLLADVEQCNNHAKLVPGSDEIYKWSQVFLDQLERHHWFDVIFWLHIGLFAWGVLLFVFVYFRYKFLYQRRELLVSSSAENSRNAVELIDQENFSLEIVTDPPAISDSTPNLGHKDNLVEIMSVPYDNTPILTI